LHDVCANLLFPSGTAAEGQRVVLDCEFHVMSAARSLSCKRTSGYAIRRDTLTDLHHHSQNSRSGTMQLRSHTRKDDQPNNY
jgi:hypothetical protein